MPYALMVVTPNERYKYLVEQTKKFLCLFRKETNVGIALNHVRELKSILDSLQDDNQLSDVFSEIADLKFILDRTMLCNSLRPIMLIEIRLSSLIDKANKHV